MSTYAVLFPELHRKPRYGLMHRQAVLGSHCGSATLYFLRLSPQGLDVLSSDYAGKDAIIVDSINLRMSGDRAAIWQFNRRNAISYYHLAPVVRHRLLS